MWDQNLDRKDNDSFAIFQWGEKIPSAMGLFRKTTSSRKSGQTSPILHGGQNYSSPRRKSKTLKSQTSE
jgi:hypothetical protein